ncbi:MAG TPA: hypothetical protein VK629_08820, partial [Steroidobacteraceae bacterium]|nr:hypothetical protein [Steroidobacteraceae bacterium]
ELDGSILIGSFAAQSSALPHIADLKDIQRMSYVAIYKVREHFSDDALANLFSRYRLTAASDKPMLDTFSVEQSLCLTNSSSIKLRRSYAKLGPVSSPSPI